GLQQLGREVVHTVVTRVFQGVQRDRLARARHPGDENHLPRHDLGPVRVTLVSSISRACASVVWDRCSPPSMRATSATRCSFCTGATVLNAPASPRSLATTM